jgi:sucrose-6F-phosphate phosphohydrolase
MWILATDLDRTLLPNGKWPADADAIPLFNRLVSQNDVVLVYVTGRNLALAESAISEFGVRYPDVLCGDVGTTVRRRQDDQWHYDRGWEKTVHRGSPHWNVAAIKSRVRGIRGLDEQEAEHLNPFKQSYYVDHARREAILAELEARLAGNYDETLIYSHDSVAMRGLLDILPRSANKKTAIEYVAEEFGCMKERVVFCGDSGNDILPMQAGFAGVLVKNADSQLVREVRAAMHRDPLMRVYQAVGDFRGLNGNYASGVIEGCYHYGVFQDPDCRDA